MTRAGARAVLAVAVVRAIRVALAGAVARARARARVRAMARARARGWTGGGEVEGVCGGIGSTATAVVILARQRGSRAPAAGSAAAGRLRYRGGGIGGDSFSSESAVGASITYLSTNPIPTILCLTPIISRYG